MLNFSVLYDAVLTHGGRFLLVGLLSPLQETRGAAKKHAVHSAADLRELDVVLEEDGRVVSGAPVPPQPLKPSHQIFRVPLVT